MTFSISLGETRGTFTTTLLHISLQSEREHELKINEQREKQRELICQLKSQLEDLETYAYEVCKYMLKVHDTFIVKIFNNFHMDNIFCWFVMTGNNSIFEQN